MKKKVLNVLLLLVLTFGVIACGKTVTLDNIVKKFNDSETVKAYKNYGYELSASTTKDVLTISSTVGEDKSTVEFKLEGNVLSNENLSNEDLMLALILIDSVGQTYGYKDGELAQNMNAFSDKIKKYTLDKEGFELVIGDEDASIKIDISKKIPLISMDKFYLTTDDFDIISQIIADNENGNQSGKNGNIAYDVFVGDAESTIQIGQTEKLSDSAYKSIISALKVMYGENVANHFQEVYPKFIEGKTTIERFTIETDYKIEDQDESIFKDTKVVLVTINNNL